MRLIFLVFLVSVAHAEHFPALRGQHGMVAADSALAAQVGADLLSAGGDAVDAAVATALVLGVVQPFASGIGGGGFAVVHRTDGTAFALDFREVAPAGATRDMYLDSQGNVVPDASTLGPRAAGVPGEVAGLYELHRRHGRLPWKQVVAPAVKLARDGFAMHALLQERVAARRDAIAQIPDLAQSFLDAAGQPLPLGALVRRPALGRTLAAVQARGSKGFYEGPVAVELARAQAADGGLITAADLATYRWKERPLLRGTWRGHEVLSMPPPSSGGVVLMQVLRVLEADDLVALGHNSSAYLHRLAEALKHAFADRARVMGDPDFTPVPVEALVGDAAVARVRAAFKPDATLPREAYGDPAAVPEDGGTSHLSVIDAQGNAVALTTTVNTAFGSLYVAGNTGILLNNEMDDFIAKPGVPNAFGLVGRAANAVQPGKRPLSSMTPTLVLKDGRVVLAVGGSGGPTIITATIQVLLNILIFQQDPRAAVEAPRIHHQWVPEVLAVEGGIPADVTEALGRRGHAVKPAGRFSAVQAIVVGPDGLRGASDPSKLGAPASARPHKSLKSKQKGSQRVP